MVRLHDTYDMHAIFAPGFPGMLECFHIQEKLVQTLMPEVHKVFEENNITISSFATKWYITLFANGISFSTQLRIWDAFLLEGKDVLILVPTAIIWVLRRKFRYQQLWNWGRLADIHSSLCWQVTSSRHKRTLSPFSRCCPASLCQKTRMPSSAGSARCSNGEPYGIRWRRGSRNGAPSRRRRCRYAGRLRLHFSRSVQQSAFFQSSSAHARSLVTP